MMMTFDYFSFLFRHVTSIFPLLSFYFSLFLSLVVVFPEAYIAKANYICPSHDTNKMKSIYVLSQYEE